MGKKSNKILRKLNYDAKKVAEKVGRVMMALSSDKNWKFAEGRNKG